MAVTYSLSTEHNNYPNITVYDRFSDGEQRGWRINANEGYVFHDTNDNDVEYDENGNEIPVVYYYTVAYLPRNYNWANFSWVAVPRDSVDENYIFGVGGNNHEAI